MASSIASLFGPSAEEIVYAKQQEDKALRQQQLQQGLAMQASPLAQQFYQAGYNIVSGLGGLFGKPMLDPAMTKAVEIRRLLADTNANDLNDPAKLTTLAAQFGDAGYPKEALYFADRARTIAAENRAYELSMAKYQQDISEQVMEPNFKVKSTGDSVYMQNGKYYNAKTGARVPVEDLISVKDITSASTPAVSEVISIENLYLDDTDFSEQEKDRVAKFLDQYALAIQKEPDFVNKPKEVALKEAWKRSTEQGIIAKTEDTWITKYTPFTATDWVFRPELMTEVPFKPIEDKSGKFKIKSITKN
jgi:hypothetical protein